MNKPSRPPLPACWQVFIALLVLCGSALRFVNLEKKPYWHDETYTALRVSGYDQHDEVEPRLYTGQVVTRGDFQVFQRANQEKSAIDTARGLARKEPQLPPGYFVAARTADHLMGDTVTATRGLSAVCAVLTLPALFWLCLEWSGSPRVAWMAMGLAAVSPLFVRYAQEARPYSMWLLLVLLANVAFLRMIRNPGRKNWSLYALWLTLALYTHLLSVMTMAAHGIYLVVSGTWRSARVRRSWLIASASAALLFVPWVAVVLLRKKTAIATTSHLSRPLPLGELLERWAQAINSMLPGWPVSHPVAVLVAVPVMLLVLYALYALYRDPSRDTWLYLILLIVVSAGPFFLWDLALGGQRSVRPKYMLPAYLGALVAVARLLAGRLCGRLWQSLALAVLLTGLVSSAASVRAETWWGLSEVEVDLARILNQSPRPLVISDVPFGVIAPLSRRVHPEVGFLLTRRPTDLEIPAGYEPVYVYQPSDQLRGVFEHRPGWILFPTYKKPREDGTVFSLFQAVRQRNAEISGDE
jgi:uncharacterized membrane protein